MYSISAEPRFTIMRLGDYALTCLASGQQGDVVAALSKGVYLKTGAGNLFWLVTSDVPMHRRAAQVNGSLPMCPPGSRWRVHGHVATIGEALVVDLNGSATWQPSRFDPGRAVARTDASHRIRDLFKSMDLSHSTGFGEFIPQIARLAGVELAPHLSICSDPVLGRAQPLVLGSACASRDNDPDALYVNGVALIGLGGGLTPSGDDFVGGLLFCLKHLGQTRLAMELIDAVRRAGFLSAATNEISAAILMDLARGHAVAPLHEFVNRLLMGESIASIHPFIPELTGLGHSTGWDLLAGVLTGLLAARGFEDGPVVRRMTESMAA